MVKYYFSLVLQRQHIVSMALRLVLGVVFMWAGITKIANPDGFIRSLMVYQLFPAQWSGLAVGMIAGLLPWCEILLGIACMVGYKLRTTATALAGLLVVFMIILGVTLWRGIDIACGCFGSQNEVISAWHFVRNSALMASAIYLAWSNQQQWTVESMWLRYFS
jgi:uncharacterized membrane protein YphA (DoxX/SURF4 family)